MTKTNPSELTAYEESIGFYYELGRAITAWAHVELALLWLTGLCFSKANRDHAAITFYSIDAFYNKLKVVDRLLRNKYTKEHHIKKWRDLSKSVESLSKIRN